MNDGSPLDSNIFTVDISSIPMSLDIYSDDLDDAKTYNLEVKAEYADYSGGNGEIVFDVTILNMEALLDL
jgi:hypothetical protein